MEAVRSERIELDVDDGTRMFADVAYAAEPARGGIIVLQDAYGVNDQLREIAARCATIGYTAVAPELYHRTAPGLVAAYDDARNPLRLRARTELSDEGMTADLRAGAGWLTGIAGVGADRLFALGFCMGGRAAFLANARLPLRAAIAFYGGGIAPRFLDAAREQHGDLLMFWGGDDSHISTDQRRAVADALTTAGARHTQVVFSHARHGFFGHRQPDYDAAAARQAWALVTAFLAADD